MHGHATAFDFGQTEVLTFDCYGTLVDWETGILGALRQLLPGLAVPDDELLEAHARHETALEAGPYRPYREVLARALFAIAADFGVVADEEQAHAYADAAADWPPFADSSAALAGLARRYRLGVITNCDDDIFAASRRQLGVEFEWVLTAEQARSYKPSLRNFELALERIGLPRERILHVAQSLFHDHVPAHRLGLRTAWIDRRRGRGGFGATPPATAEPDLAVADMESFARLALG